MKSSRFTHTAIASILAAASLPTGNGAHAFSKRAGNPINLKGWQVKGRAGDPVSNPTDADNNQQPPANTPDIADLLKQIESLKAHNQTLLNEKKAEKQKREQEQAEKQRLEEENARKSGDVDTINKQWQEKYAKLEAEIAARDAKQAKEAVNSAAFKLASSLTSDNNNAEILADIITRRLKFENDAVKVLNLNGEISINSLDELKSELIASGKYNSLIQGTQASGVGANGPGGTKPANEMTEKERLALLKSDPQRFKQLFGNKK